MAYKNQKKNKDRQSEIRSANASKKHEREAKRNHKGTPVMTENDYLRIMRIMRQQGLIL